MARWVQKIGIFVMCASVALGAGSASAQSRDARAKELFVKGITAYAKQNYAAALVFFRKSYELKPKPVVLLNIANCYRALFQYKKSIEAFRKYLRVAGRKLSWRKRKQLQAYIQEMEAKLGHVALDVQPSGAEVLLDGQLVGKTPLTGDLTMDPGTHVIIVRKDGYQTYRKDLEVLDGQHLALAVVLRPTEAGKGTIVVRSKVADAKVSVDGALAVPVPATLELTKGRHVLLVTAPGHRPKSIVVEVTTGMNKTFDVDLEALPQAQPRPQPEARPRPAPRPRPAARPRPRPASQPKARPVPKEAVQPVVLKQKSEPVYEKWWFWTAIGGAVLVGVILGGYFGAKAAQGTSESYPTVQYK